MTLEVIEKELTDTDIRVLKKNTCPSLSGRSTLTYQIASTSDFQLLVHIDKNSGGGIFSREWLSLDTIIKTLKAQKEPFNWNVFCPLFEKQSVNTAGFMMAVLKDEGLVQSVERRYELLDTKGFMADVKGLITKNSKPRKTSTAKKTNTTKSRSAK